MTILGDVDPRHFLAAHWQLTPLLVRGALPRAEAEALVDGDDLAGLACEPDVASRLVIHDPKTKRWECEHGPFDAERFARLPASDWSLLVQAVDQWIPALAGLGARFDFLPRWRLDDVMVSYASDGGGVGPHYDHYDVFLVQTRGARQWLLGPMCDGSTPIADHPDLKLMPPFEPLERYTLEPGDMLYLPPGQAHHGIAQGDDCVTCSVGFRAPSERDVLQGMAAALAEDIDPTHGEHRRYRDTPKTLSSDPFLLSAELIRQLRHILERADADAIDLALASGFGRQVTEPHDPDLIIAGEGPPSAATLRAALTDGQLRLSHAPTSRFAYLVHANRGVLFVDGERFMTHPNLARDICHETIDATAIDHPTDLALLQELVQRGALRLP